MVSLSRPMPRIGLHSLPTLLSHWLGYRAVPSTPPAAYALYVWPFIGSFGGLAILQAVFGHSNYFISRGVPAIIPSYGASAVLVFDKIATPLAQPRSLIGGHFLSALVGIIMAHIIWGSTSLDSSPGSVPDLSWLGASLATAIAIFVMQVTNTTHPPAGATALLPLIDPTVNALGWYFLPVVLLSSSLMLAVALLVNNLQRKYPEFWWQADGVAKTPKEEGPVLPVSSLNGNAMKLTVLGSPEDMEESSQVDL